MSMAQPESDLSGISHAGDAPTYPRAQHGEARRRGMRVNLTVTGRNDAELREAVRVHLAALNANPVHGWVFESFDVEPAAGTPLGEVPSAWVAEACLWDGQDVLPELEL